MIRFLCPLLSLGLLASGCRSTLNDESSAIKWSHSPAKSSTAAMNARLQYLSLGYKTNFKDVSVCIQDAGFYNGLPLLFETKLAYAAWLDASGQGSPEAWAHFNFTQEAHCTMNDAAYSSVVVIGDEDKITADQQVDKTFSHNKVSCKRVGLSANCSTGSMTLGLGGPGGVSYQFVKADKWESISNRSPATVILSPYVHWTSLENELAQSTLIDTYRDLSQRAETLTYAELVSFNAQLKNRVLKRDGRLGDIVKNFLASKAPSLSQDFAPTQPGYHVLLHEVGHQFGMNHADNPSLDSETGTVTGADQVNGQWITKESTMAYADEYIYLTADDQAGIQDLAGKTLELLKARKGQ